MQPTTKAIAFFETDEDARAAGHTIPLTEAEAAALLERPRAEREAALARFRGSPVLTRTYVPPGRNRDKPRGA
jgi:hypothetical protein